MTLKKFPINGERGEQLVALYDIQGANAQQKFTAGVVLNPETGTVTHLLNRFAEAGKVLPTCENDQYYSYPAFQMKLLGKCVPSYDAEGVTMYQQNVFLPGSVSPDILPDSVAEIISSIASGASVASLLAKAEDSHPACRAPADAEEVEKELSAIPRRRHYGYNA
jgi:hypothetical protein